MTAAGMVRKVVVDASHTEDGSEHGAHSCRCTSNEARVPSRRRMIPGRALPNTAGRTLGFRTHQKYTCYAPSRQEAACVGTHVVRS